MSIVDVLLAETMLQLTFNDINGLVEQNVRLRSLVRDLSDQIENKEMEFKVLIRIAFSLSVCNCVVD